MHADRCMSACVYVHLEERERKRERREGGWTKDRDIQQRQAARGHSETETQKEIHRGKKHRDYADETDITGKQKTFNYYSLVSCVPIQLPPKGKATRNT